MRATPKTADHARQAMATVRGQAAAESLLARLRRGAAAPDAVACAAAGLQNDPAALRGFGRELQKALERAAGAGVLSDPGLTDDGHMTGNRRAHDGGHEVAP
jgi:hypothetical protein